MTLENLLNLYEETQSKHRILIYLNKCLSPLKLIPTNKIDALHYNFKDSITYKENKDNIVEKFTINDTEDGTTYLIITLNE